MEPAEKVVQLDPKKILLAENVRFNIKSQDVEALAADIERTGGVIEPVEVEEVTDQKGYTHRLTVGYVRHAAVTLLNSRGAGLTLPALVRPSGASLERTKRQLSENIARATLSPMDCAVTIKGLMAQGVERAEIRRLFPRPTGRKGLAVQPASNAWVNMTLSFLGFPKPVQDRIHDGRIGVAAAYALTKVAPEKLQAVLDRVEADRLADLDAEEKDEAKYLASEKKVAEAVEEERTASTALETAKAAVVKAQAEVDEKIKASTTAYEAMQRGSKDKEKQKEQAKLAERFKATQTDVREAEKALNAAKKDYEKAEGKVKSVTESVSKHKERLAQARKDAAEKKPASKVKPGKVSPAAVKKAAREEGDESQYVPLKFAEQRDLIDRLASPGTWKMVAEIGKAIKECCDGKTTPKQCYNTLAELTGEKVAAGKSAELPKKKAA